MCRHYVIYIRAPDVTQVRIFCYHAAFDTWFSFSKFILDRKFMVKITHHFLYFLVDQYSSRAWRFQWPVSRKAVLFYEFISRCQQHKQFLLSTETRLCRQVYKGFALFYVDISAFSCPHVDRFMQLCRVIRSWCIFYDLQKDIRANHAFYSHNHSCMDLTNLQVRNNIWQINRYLFR